MEFKINIKTNKEEIKKNFTKELDEYIIPDNITLEEIIEVGTNNLYINSLLCEINESFLNNKEHGYEKVWEFEKSIYYIKKPNIKLSQNPFDELQLVIHKKGINQLQYHTIDKDVIFICYLIANNNFSKINLGVIDNLNDEQKLLLHDLYVNGVIKYTQKDNRATNCYLKNMGTIIKLFPNKNLTMLTSIAVSEDAKKGLEYMSNIDTLTYYNALYSISENKFLQISTLNIPKELIKVFANYYQEVLNNTKDLKTKQDISINAIDKQIIQLKGMIRTLQKEKEEILKNQQDNKENN